MQRDDRKKVASLIDSAINTLKRGYNHLCKDEMVETKSMLNASVEQIQSGVQLIQDYELDSKLNQPTTPKA